ncbi:NACHT domain-containing protein [Fusarium sp. LHS14.1]|nr:NACHT domain-containing protein [Fusarium sp. LHS14.1]
MSGFEALGLACCVFQTISFTRETANVCKAIYQGQKTPDSMLEENATAMIQAADEVKASCRLVSTPEEKSLANIAEKCAEAAKNLETEVQKITKLHKKGDFPSAMRARARSLWKKREIEELDDTLHRYTGTMQTLLINQICSQSKALELRQRQDFVKLDQKLQSFIANIAAGRTNMEDLLQIEGNLTREHITVEATRAVKSVEAHVTKETQERELKAATENQRERLLGSLRFQEMNQRRNETTDPENATFKRIFQENDSTTNLGETTESRYDTDEDNTDEDYTDKIDVVWQHFVDWLRSGEGLFWVQGKPGSGKSTLVRYIIDDEATQTLLNQWHSGTRIISHFFWKIGTPMQNNIKGLFCSLLYQLLQDNEKLISFLIHTFPLIQSKNYPYDWSDGDLERVLLTALEANEVAQPVCIFIDGLDEYNGDDGDHGLMDTIQRLIKSDKVKLCVASRPEPRLLNRLNKVPYLKLQDLTEPEMRDHIRKAFDRSVQNGNPSVEELDVLAGRLLAKAEGVFLWVRLALQTVVRGIENGDSGVELVTRLMQLPNDLEDLYADMWKRLNQDQPLYRESAATYFQLIIGTGREEYFVPDRDDDDDVQPSIPLLTSLYIACATQPTLQKTMLPMSVDTNFKGQLRELCRKTENEIRTRCAGLVEITAPEPWLRGKLPDEENPMWELLNSVKFIHRTAHDFLVDTEQGKRILSHAKFSRSEMYFQTMKGALCWIQLVSEAFETYYDVSEVLEALAKAFKLQDKYKSSSHRAMELLSVTQSFYEKGLLDLFDVQWPRAPFLVHLLETDPTLFALVEQSIDATVATDILRGVTWSFLSKTDEPRELVANLVSIGADPVAISPRAVGALGIFTGTLRKNAIWKLLDEFLFRQWSPRSSSVTARRATEAAAAMLEQCPVFDNWGLLEPFELESNSRVGSYSQNGARGRYFRSATAVFLVLEANTSFLLKHVLDSLSTPDRTELKSVVQQLESRVTNPAARVFSVLFGPGSGQGSWFRVVNQSPFQNITASIFSYAPRLNKNLDSRQQFQGWRLGPCKLEQGGFDWSHEVRKLPKSGHNPPTFRALRAAAELYGSESGFDPGSAREHDAEAF